MARHGPAAARSRRRRPGPRTRTPGGTTTAALRARNRPPREGPRRPTPARSAPAGGSTTRQARPPGRRPRPAARAPGTAWAGPRAAAPGVASASVMDTSFRRVRRGLPRCCAGAPGRSPACARVPPHPQARASSANSSESSIEISTTTVPGCVSLILRAASIPPMPGIRTSSSTSSGRRRSTAATASSPDPTSPTGSNPAVALITSRAAWRKTTWSSTVRTLTTLTSVSLMLRCPREAPCQRGPMPAMGLAGVTRGGVCPPPAASRASDRRSGPGR